MMEQYSTYPTKDRIEQKSNNKKKLKLVYIFLTILFLSIIVISIFLLKKSPVCGNGKCEKHEDCSICFKDCRCSEGTYCSEGKCVKPKCGNGKCEYFENDCCIDCGCTEPGYVCNINKNECEFKEFTVSDDRITELVSDYFESQGKEIISMNISGLVTWENKVGRYVIVKIKDQSWVSSVIVTEDEEVIDATL